jgi:hypothetical protein
LAQRTFFGTVRIAVLLAVLVFVAMNAWLDRRRSTSWERTLRVTIYPWALSADEATRAYAKQIDDADFATIPQFFAAEAEAFSLTLAEPVRVRVSQAVAETPPLLDPRPNALEVLVWSLRMRYWAWRVAVDDPLPTPDVQVFALYHPGASRRALPDSVGTTKGLMAVAHLFADDSARGGNATVIAHELLHTLGATDKYDLATGLPHVPAGLGEPDRRPTYPQDFGEIMAGRIAVSANEAVVPDGLEQMLVGTETAREIGWTR